MSSDQKKSALANTPPDEIIVPSHWAEAMLAKGLLQLTAEQMALLESDTEIRLPRSLVETANPKVTRSRAIEWIEPIDAVHSLSPLIGGDSAAKLAIAERLRDGAIACTYVWMSEGPDIGPIGAQRPKFPVAGTGAILAPWVTPVHTGKGSLRLGGVFWAYSDNWDADLKRWDWQSGIFAASQQTVGVFEQDGVPIRQVPLDHRTRMIVSGIRFSKDDVALILGDVSRLPAQGGQTRSVGPKQSTSTSRRGRKKDDAWSVWFAEVLVYAELNGIDTNQKADDFHAEINKRIYSRDPDQKYLLFETVEKTIGVIMNRWREARAKGEV